MLTYRTQLIPMEALARTGRKLLGGRATSLTVHNTANPNATADNHADWLTRDLDAGVSPHIFVDDKEAVRVLPLNEQGWHAGTNAGNTTSVGIEVCEFSDRARQDATDENAQRLIADMLTGKAPAGWNLTHLTIKDVRTHQSWSGKYCPRMLLPWWGRFIAETQQLMGEEAQMYIYGVVVDLGDPAHRSALRAIAAKYNDKLVEGAIAVAYHAAQGENADAYIAYTSTHGLEHHSDTNGEAGRMVLRSAGTVPSGDNGRLADYEARFDRIAASLAAAQGAIPK